MADITGALSVEHNGARYSLRLTMRGIAKLQEEFGRDIAGLLSGDVATVPDFGAILRVVEIALAKGNPSMADDKIKDLADDIATVDLVGRIVQAAFPDAEERSGNVKRARKAA
jgi:hypothetical protein